MACGLPFVTEIVEHGPEIMYFKNGSNGVIVPSGRIDLLATVLRNLIDDDTKRREMGEASRHTYLSEMTIDRMYQGFIDAVRHVI
jgi:glycosyltransferase involved in cell wall biosynthesis